MVSKNRKVKQLIVTAIFSGLVLVLISHTIGLEVKTLNIHQIMLKAQSFFVSIHMEPEMVQIQGGAFQQGDVEGRGDSDERPVRMVTVKSFALGKYEVTFEEYDRFAIAGGRSLSDDSNWGRGSQPMIYVSWQDAKDYAQWLSEKTQKHYRLPTESEWEYAMRKGVRLEALAGTFGESQLEAFAVFKNNSSDRTSVVGTKQPNGLGLYDVSGNVWEWVEDCWHKNYMGAPKDGSAWQEVKIGGCGQHVIRGGSWYKESEDLRPSKRGEKMFSYRGNGVGFRLAQDLP